MSTEAAQIVTASRPAVREQQLAGTPGLRVLPLCILALAVGVVLVILGVRLQVHHSAPTGVRVILWVVGAVLALAAARALGGLTQVTPGEAVVVQLFGGYQGTIRDPGLRWVNPLAVRHRVSVKIRSYQTPVTKVNDADGNPIEIAVVVVWRVTDTAKATFAVDDVREFVATQVEIAVRQMASSYPYDDQGTGRPCLRSSSLQVADELAADISARVVSAGAAVSETRITQLSYAPEIAHAMLRRQQAGAIVAARQKIVDGAVGMVESALAKLATDGIVELDEERKAAMVSNMLVVLCSDHATQPVVNTGTLYQ
jgi:hypothetical protein